MAYAPGAMKVQGPCDADAGHEDARPKLAARVVQGVSDQRERLVAYGSQFERGCLEQRRGAFDRYLFFDVRPKSPAMLAKARRASNTGVESRCGSEPVLPRCHPPSSPAATKARQPRAHQRTGDAF